jgi:Protein of unknown function (DUF3105)
MASRKEQKEALRAERERKAQEAAAAERRKRMIGFGAAGLLVAVAVIAIVAVLLAGGGDDDDGGGGGDNASESREAEPTDDFQKASIPAAKGTNLEQAAKAAGCTVKTFPAEGRSHVSGQVEYKTNPPTSGNHFEVPAADGAYRVGPELEPLVHSLEHGRVILWYQPNASPQLQGQLKSLFDEDTYHMILSPNGRNMPSQVAASSWTRSITCERVNNNTWDALRLFRDRYRDQAPEQVP